MFKKYSKIALLLFFIASSTCLTSCKKDADAPTPVDCNCSKDDIKKPKEEPKEEPDKDPKTIASKILTRNRWVLSKHTGGGMMSAPITGLHFKSDTHVDVFYGNFKNPFDESTVKEKEYRISTKGEKIEIGGSRYSFETLQDSKITLKSSDGSYSFDNDSF